MNWLKWNNSSNSKKNEDGDQNSPLHEIRGLSRKGYQPFNAGKVNQDRFIDIPVFGALSPMACLGVFDGHGVNGHIVSQFLVDTLPTQVSACLMRKQSINDALSTGFSRTTDLLKAAKINSSMSGSTANIVLVEENDIYCANVGDSRAVLGHVDESGNVKAVPLSFDHKPSDSKERNRIEAMNGRVEACRGPYGNPVGPARVWLKGRDIPGLAMSRAFGDGVASSVGVISVPDVTHRKRVDGDKFIIVASDGVWEFISSQEAVEMANLYQESEPACKHLVDEALKRWKKEENVVDDITVVVSYL